MENNSQYKNPNTGLPQDQYHRNTEGLYDPVSHGVVARRAVNVQQDTSATGQTVFYGDSVVSTAITSDSVASGTLTAAQPLPGTPVAGGTVTLNLGDGQSTWEIELSGTFSAGSTVLFEGSDDGTVWDSAVVADTTQTTPTPVTSLSGPLTTGTAKIFRGIASGYQEVRVRCTPYQSGDSISVRLIGSTGSGGGSTAGSNVNIAQVNGATPNIAQETGGNLAGIKADLDEIATDTDNLLTIATNTTGIATAANQTTGNASLSGIKSDLDEIATDTDNLAGMKSDLDTLAGAVSSGKFLVEGAYTETDGLSVNALNGVLASVTDGRNYRWYSLHITGTWVGTLTFQVSNTGNSGDWQSIEVWNTSSSSNIASTTTGNGVFVIPGGFKYFQVTAAAWTSGTANGVLIAYTTPVPLTVLAVYAAQQGTWNVGLTAGTNMIGHTVVDSGNISAFTYDFDGITNDRRRNVTGVTPQSTNSVTSQTSTSATFGSATGLQPGQAVLLTGGTADEVVVTSTSYTAGATAVTWGTVQPAYTNHTGAIWLAQGADGPGTSLLPLLESAFTYLAALSETAGRGISLQADAAGRLFVDPRKEYVQLQSNTYTGVTVTQDGADIAVGQYTELCVNINCSAYTGSGNVVIKVQRKDSFGNYITLGNSSNITSTGLLVMSVGPGLSTNHSLGNTIRVEVNVPTSTPPTITITIDVGGK